MYVRVYNVYKVHGGVTKYMLEVIKSMLKGTLECTKYTLQVTKCTLECTAPVILHERVPNMCGEMEKV